MSGTEALPEGPSLPAGLLTSFRELVEQRTGLVLDERRVETLAARVAELAAEPRHGSPEAVLAACRAESGPGGLFEQLLGELTIRETFFFRNRPHFRALADVVFPELFRAAEDRRELTVWSAGCSTGEEPYSLAMTACSTADRLGIDLARWRVRILGTDLTPEFLDIARTATYGRYSFRGVTDEEKAAYFEEVGEDQLRVLPRYRSLVELRAFNIAADRFPDPGTPFHDVDLIVCRNVTIYFSRATTRGIANRFFDTLREGGYLIVGHSEHSLETYRRFETRALPDVILYQRGGDVADAGPGADASWMLAAPARPESSRVAQPGRSRRFTTLDLPASATQAAPVATPSAPTMRAALAALEDGDYNQAVDVAVQVLERDPEDADACLLLGELAADRGHLAEAEIWLRRTLEIRPLDLTSHYVLALLASERQDVRTALDYLHQATYIDPSCVMAHYLAARLNRQLGSHAEEQRCLRAARTALRSLPDGEVRFAHGLTATQLRPLLGAEEK